MKKIPWRGAFYVLLIAYLFLDFKVIDGPVRNAMRSQRDAAVIEAKKRGWVALVNLEPVTRGQLDLAVARHLHQRGQSAAGIPPKNLEMIRRAVLQGLIDETLIRQHADGEKHEASAEEKKAIAAAWWDGVADADGIAERLAQHGLNAGLAAEELGRNVSRMRWLERRISPAVPVSEQEARDWFAANGGGKLESSEELPGFIEPRKVRLRYRLFEDEARAQGFFADPSKPSPDAEANELWIAVDQLAPALREAAVGDPGWRQPIQSARGWIVVELIKTKEARALAFDEVRAEIVAHLEAERAETTVRELFGKLRTVANLQVFPENL